MKIFKKSLALLMVVALMLSLVACGKTSSKDSGASSNETTPTKQSTEPSATPEETKAEESIEDILAKGRKNELATAIAYIQMVTSGNFGEALDFYELPKSSIVTTEDVKWALERTEYGDYIGSEYVVVSLDSSANGVFGTVDVGIAKTEDAAEAEEYLTVKLTRGEDNRWYVETPRDFVTYKFCVAANCVVKINDIEVNATEKGDNYNNYDVLCVPKKSVLCVENTTFGNFKTDILPSDTTDREKYLLDISGILGDELANKLQSDFNSIYSAYIDGSLNRLTLSEYFAADVDVGTLDTILEDLKSGTTASTGTFTNVIMSNAKLSDGSYVYFHGDNVITLNVRGEIFKMHSVSVLGTETLNFNCFVRYQKNESGDYKIVEISDVLMQSGGAYGGDLKDIRGTVGQTDSAFTAIIRPAVACEIITGGRP